MNKIQQSWQCFLFQFFTVLTVQYKHVNFTLQVNMKNVKNICFCIAILIFFSIVIVVQGILLFAGRVDIVFGNSLGLILLFDHFLLQVFGKNEQNTEILVVCSINDMLTLLCRFIRLQWYQIYIFYVLLLTQKKRYFFKNQVFALPYP